MVTASCAAPAVQAEGDGDTVVAGRQEGGGARPGQSQEGQQVGPDTGWGRRGLRNWANRAFSGMQGRISTGILRVFTATDTTATYVYLVTAWPFSASATEMEQSCATQASLVPAELKDTACTQPPPIGELVNSAIIWGTWIEFRRNTPKLHLVGRPTQQLLCLFQENAFP